MIIVDEEKAFKNSLVCQYFQHFDIHLELTYS